MNSDSDSGKPRVKHPSIELGWFILLPVAIVMGFMVHNRVLGMIQSVAAAALFGAKIYRLIKRP